MSKTARSRPATPIQVDRRLLGTWRSDRRRTMADWGWPRSMKPDRRKWFAGLFGHLKLRYTPRYQYSDYKGYCERECYEVVAMDADSVAILCSPGHIQHIHFEDDHYWISLGRNREWFKRVKSKRRQAAARR